MALILDNSPSFSNAHYTFKNKKKEPLENVFVTLEENGVKREVPALSVQFSTSRCMATFCPPPRKNVNGDYALGARENWHCRMNLCATDFRWLLDLSYHRFWSQIVYQKSSLEGLITFLQNAYPCYTLDLLPNDPDIVETYSDINRLAFYLVSRITTRIESEYEWMGEKKFAELLYDGFLISIPMLLDVCAIFGSSNSQEVERIIKSVISTQPSYLEDIEACMREVREVFSSIEDRISSGFPCGDLVKGIEKVKDKGESLIFTLQDILYYILDVAATLSTFAEMSLEAALVMHNSNLEVQIVAMYENTVLTLSQHLKRLCSGCPDHGQYMDCLNKLNLIRFYLIEMFHYTISAPVTCLIENSEKLSDDEKKKQADSYIGVLSDCVGDKFFMSDYCKKYSFDQDLDVLAQICPELDSFKYDYLLESLVHYRKPHKEPSPSSSWGISTRSPCPEEVLDNMPEPKKVVGVELDSLITEVKDIFGHLGEGFIQKCLQHYNYSSSTVINSILENSLPENLSALDPEMPFILEEEESPWAKHQLPERVNVFDNDEFDIMTRDVIDSSKVIHGKRKEKHRDLKELLDDKTHREEFRDMYTKLGNVESLEEGYDDEYDDTYDTVDIAVEEAGEQERRQFEVPRVLQKYSVRRGVEEDAPVEAEEQEQHALNFDAFVENPELRRARFEERRASKGRPNSSKDVVGKPKGQGQEKEVTVNRYRKGVHKSSQGNHNRRRGAQHKRNQGMLHM